MPRQKTNWMNLWLNGAITLSTLADQTALEVSGGTTMTEPSHVIKIRFGHVHVDNLPSGSGPLWFGLHNDEVDLNQIVQALAVNPPNSRDDDQVALATRLRNFEVIGVIGGHPGGPTEKNYLDIAGREVNFRLPDGNALHIFVVNMSGGALVTGGTFYFAAQVLGKWLD